MPHDSVTVECFQFVLGLDVRDPFTLGPNVRVRRLSSVEWRLLERRRVFDALHGWFGAGWAPSAIELQVLLPAVDEAAMSQAAMPVAAGHFDLAVTAMLLADVAEFADPAFMGTYLRMGSIYGRSPSAYRTEIYERWGAHESKLSSAEQTTIETWHARLTEYEAAYPSSPFFVAVGLSRRANAPGLSHVGRMLDLVTAVEVIIDSTHAGAYAVGQEERMGVAVAAGGGSSAVVRFTSSGRLRALRNDLAHSVSMETDAARLEKRVDLLRRAIWCSLRTYLRFAMAALSRAQAEDHDNLIGQFNQCLSRSARGSNADTALLRRPR